MSKDRKTSIPKEGASGTEARHTPSPPHIMLLKRKALTAEQIDNVESAGSVQQHSRDPSNATMPLPDMRRASVADIFKRKPVQSRTPSEELQSANAHAAVASGSGIPLRQGSNHDQAFETNRNAADPSNDHTLFTRPYWFASAENALNVNHSISRSSSTSS